MFNVDSFNNFFWVDAFSGTILKGNPAAVCFFKGFLEDELMQKIAKEFNLSETCFVSFLGENNFKIRWFTPISEAPLCGHGTLAASHVIFNEMKIQFDNIIFNSVAGPLEVFKNENNNKLSCSENLISMIFPTNDVYEVFDNELINKIKIAINSNNVKSIWKDNLVFVVEMNSLFDVFYLEPNFDLIKKIKCRAIVVTAKVDNNKKINAEKINDEKINDEKINKIIFGEKKFDFVSRYFAPSVGIFEDPVCGSAHTRLGIFWNRRDPQKNIFSAYQSSRRGGELFVEVDHKNNKTIISGKAKTFFRGVIDFKNI